MADADANPQTEPATPPRDPARRRRRQGYSAYTAYGPYGLLGPRGSSLVKPYTLGRRVAWKRVGLMAVIAAVVVAFIAAIHTVQGPRTAAFLRERAAKLAASGEADEALRYLDMYLALRPNDTEAHLERDRYLSRTGSLAALREAYRHLGQVLRREPQRTDVRESLIAVALDIGGVTEVQKARDEARQLTDSATTRHEWELIAEAHRATGDAEDAVTALTAYRRALDLAPDHLPTWARYIDLHYRTNEDPAAAERLLRALLDANPASPRAWLVVHQVRRDHGLPGAGAALDTALQEAPDDLEVLLMAIGDALATGQRDTGALLERAYQLAPQDQRVQLLYGKWQARRDTRTALRELIRGFDQSGDPAFAGLVAELLLERGELEGLGRYLDAVAGDPAYQPLYLFLIGRRDMLQGEFRRAELRFRLGQERLNAQGYPTDANELRYRFALGLAGCAYQLGRLDEAERLAEEAHRLFPGDATPLLTLGGIRMTEGEYGQALADFQLASRSSACPPAVWFEIARALLYVQWQKPIALRDEVRFLTAVDRARARTPDLAGLDLLLAEYELKRGDLAAAARTLETAVELHPDDPHLLLSLLRVRILQGDSGTAAGLIARMEKRFGISLGLILSRARYDLERRRPDVARAVLERMLPKVDGATRVELWLALADVFAHDGRPADARKALETAAAEFPTDPSVLVALLDLLIRQEDWQAALTLRDQIAERAPGSPLARWADVVLLHGFQAEPTALTVIWQQASVDLAAADAAWWGSYHVRGLAELSHAPPAAAEFVDPAFDALAHASLVGPMVDILLDPLRGRLLENGWGDDFAEWQRTIAQRRAALPVDRQWEAEGVLASGDAKTALERAEELRASFPQDLRLARWHVDFLDRAGAPQQADEALAALVERAASEPATWYLQARLARRRGSPSLDELAERVQGAELKSPHFVTGQVALVLGEATRATSSFVLAADEPLGELAWRTVLGVLREEASPKLAEVEAKARVAFPDAPWLDPIAR